MNMAPSRKSKAGKRGAALRDVSPDVRVYKKSRKKVSNFLELDKSAYCMMVYLDNSLPELVFI